MELAYFRPPTQSETTPCVSSPGSAQSSVSPGLFYYVLALYILAQRLLHSEKQERLASQKSCLSLTLPFTLILLTALFSALLEKGHSCTIQTLAFLPNKQDNKPNLITGLGKNAPITPGHPSAKSVIKDTSAQSPQASHKMTKVPVSCPPQIRQIC